MAQFTREAASKIAQRLGGDTNFTLAVADVESGGRSDLPSGKMQILFEAHWFSKFTGGKYDSDFPDISSPSWNKSLYVGGEGEWSRLEKAAALDPEAAYKSASYGLFQFMGFNHKVCGFATVDEFVEFLSGPDDNDMEAFIRFVSATPGLLQAYRNQDAYEFARYYNGTGQIEYYGNKINQSKARFAAQDKPDVAQVNDIWLIQTRLYTLGFDPGPIDGVWGKKTYNAVIAFQRAKGLTADGIVGPITRAALGINS